MPQQRSLRKQREFNASSWSNLDFSSAAHPTTSTAATTETTTTAAVHNPFPPLEHQAVEDTPVDGAMLLPPEFNTDDLKLVVAAFGTPATATATALAAAAAVTLPQQGIVYNVPYASTDLMQFASTAAQKQQQHVGWGLSRVLRGSSTQSETFCIVPPPLNYPSNNNNSSLIAINDEFQLLLGGGGSGGGDGGASLLANNSHDAAALGRTRTRALFSPDYLLPHY